jgi:hypothetical protein
MGQVADALTSQPLQGRLSTAVAHLAAALAANLARDQPLLTAMATGSAARATHLLQQPLPPPICIGDVNEAIEGPDTVAEKDEPTADPLARFPYTDC